MGIRIGSEGCVQGGSGSSVMRKPWLLLTLEADLNYNRPPATQNRRPIMSISEQPSTLSLPQTNSGSRRYWNTSSSNFPSLTRRFGTNVSVMERYTSSTAHSSPNTLHLSLSNASAITAKWRVSSAFLQRRHCVQRRTHCGGL